MSKSIKLRIAKARDAKVLAKLHYKLRRENSAGIFNLLGLRFLATYYKIMLQSPHFICICAENEKKEIVGFNSCTLDAKEQQQTLRSHRIRLVLSALPDLIMKPFLIKELYLRYKSTGNQSDAPRFFVSEGVRGEFWAWDIDDKSPEGSILLNIGLRDTLRALGVQEYFYEVDATNKKVLAYHKLYKDEIVDEITLPDGRLRYLMKSNLRRK